MSVLQIATSRLAGDFPEGQSAALLATGGDLGDLPTVPTLPFPEANSRAAARVSNAASGENGFIIPADAAPVLMLALNERWQAYRHELRQCQRNFSEEAVHQLRVASRRLMSQLIMLNCIGSAPEAEAARRLLKRRLKALGALRDTHVLRLFAQRRSRRFPALLLLRQHLEKRERQLEKKVAVKVRGFKTHKLEQWISRVGERLVSPAPRGRRADRLPAAAIKATASAYREVVRRRKAIDPAVPKTIHRTRIAFKRFRYMVEGLSPDFTGLGKTDLRALARYQRRMGNLQDLEVVQSFVADFVRGRAELETLLRPFFRHLQQRRRQASRAFLKSADELYDFWPPAPLRRQSDPAPALHAA